jgi:hypothetical protein
MTIFVPRIEGLIKVYQDEKTTTQRYILKTTSTLKYDAISRIIKV